MKNTEKEAQKLKCPNSLHILSGFNYLFSIFAIWAIITYAISKGYGLRFNLRSLAFVLYVPSIFCYLISANGYLKLSWLRGYVAGNAAALLHLSFAVIHIITGKLPRPELQVSQYIRITLGIIYPAITLFLLNVKHRKLFLKSRGIKEKPDDELKINGDRLQW